MASVISCNLNVGIHTHMTSHETHVTSHNTYMSHMTSHDTANNKDKL